MPSPIFPLLAGRIFSLFWNVLFGLYFFYPISASFKIFFFASTFWFISSSCIVQNGVLILIVRLSVVVFSTFQQVPAESDWLILTECQPVYGWFMSRDLNIAFIISLYLHFLSFFFRYFYAQSYRIQIIFEQIYLIYRFDLTGTTTLGQSGSWCNGNCNKKLPLTIRCRLVQDTSFSQESCPCTGEIAYSKLAW